jgi:hypothetical protein
MLNIKSSYPTNLAHSATAYKVLLQYKECPVLLVLGKQSCNASHTGRSNSITRPTISHHTISHYMSWYLERFQLGQSPGIYYYETG